MSVPNCGPKEEVTGANLKRMIELMGLVPNTRYTVAVRAFTDAGPGPLGDSMSRMTLKSGESLYIIVDLHGYQNDT